MTTRTPLEAIRAKCTWCCMDQYGEITLCPAEKCPLWHYRHGTMPKIEGRSSLKAIRAKCPDCVGWSPSEVAACTSECELSFYKSGRNPNIRLSDEQKKARVDRLKSKTRVNPEVD